MIEVNRLTKKYGSKVALNNISFKVSKGEIVGLLGPNGAGKTTTMNILTGYLSTTEGDVKIGGVDILENPIQAKKSIGYLPEQPPLYFDMTVEEQLGFVYKVKGLKDNRNKLIEEACELVRIADMRKRLIKNLSKGYRQRVGLAQALLGSPDVLIMDEPTEGLDPKQNIEIRNVIKGLGKKHTIILSSHILSEVSALCERILIINKGKLVADGLTSSISDDILGGHKLMVRVASPTKDVIMIIKNISGVVDCEATPSIEPGACDYIIETDKGVDIRKPMVLELAAKGYPVLVLKPMVLSLEEIFMNLTSNDDEIMSINSEKAEGEALK
jgi:ABC-2 type transport system ATP-binding protein